MIELGSTKRDVELTAKAILGTPQIGLFTRDRRVYNSQGDLAGIVRSGTGGTRKSIYSGDAKAIKPVLQSDPPFPTLRKHYGKPSLDSRKIARMAVNYTLADIRRVQGLV